MPAASGNEEQDVPLQARELMALGREAAALQLLRAHGNAPRARLAMLDHLLAEQRREDARALLEGGAGPDAALEEAVLSHLGGNVARAAQLLGTYPSEGPAGRFARHHLGRALHNLGDRRGALAAIESVVREDPDYAEAWVSLALVRKVLGDHQGATQALAQAGRLAPTLTEPALARATSLLDEGRQEEALTIVETVVSRRPEHPGARLLLAQCLQLARRFGEAAAAYRKLDMDGLLPEFRAQALAGLARTLGEAGDTDASADAYARAIDMAPDERLWAELASLHERANRLEDAREAVARGLAAFPASVRLAFESARLLRRSGRWAEALAAMRAIEGSGVPGDQAPWFRHELAIQLDHAGNHAEAFREMRAAKRLGAIGLRARSVDRGAFDRMLDAMEQWQRTHRPRPSPDGDLGGDLCFLVGFPRSGTTLLDLMLDAHPQLVSVEEQPTIERVLHHAGSLPKGFGTAVDSPHSAAARRRYRDLLDGLGVRVPAGGMVVDKMPIRSAFAYFIHRLFPDARFIFALRHPFDVVLSNFFQLYAANEVFVHFDSLEESARIYGRVMDAWEQARAAIPASQVHVVRYEALVDQPAAVVAGVFGFLGVPEPAATTDHREVLARREVHTNSYQQVAEPVHTRSRNRWRSYSRELQPVMEQLRPCVERYGYALGE